ncbi:hypothetical protein PHYPO_G00249120 [Pangasianodon hypophthalmus]|uniref:Uncharacterized protein n=1 Tax=Pangasianodon hypophthalmus TaxID=310915 RepID=A0A5N5JKH9_PANHP|nr:hypothetical protein PHYPO_G00249120 [Pangasianodon hypophthalmus]
MKSWVRPRVQLHALLKDAGADKDVFTMKEVMFYLGEYIMSKELYDKQQQHIVHCGNNALGAVFGVASFSVKEPQALYAMISKHLIAVQIPEFQSTFREGSALSEADRGPEETNPRSSTSTQQLQQRGRLRSSDPMSLSVEESSEPRKRHKSDSISLTFDDSLSCLQRERGSSEPSVSHSNSDIDRSPSDEGDESDDSVSDKFSVEFEVESIESDTYSENDEDSIPGEDLKVYDAEDEASFDEDTEITEEPSTSSSQEKTPELERTTSLNSTMSCLPAYCLEPCVICQSRPKNGCIVHRRTGHLMACYICAKKLKKHNKLCPVCREPIQSVVLTYVS